MYSDVKSLDDNLIEKEVPNSSSKYQLYYSNFLKITHLVFKRFDTRILRKQFNFIKNNINSDNPNNIIEEDLYEDNEEDPNFEKDRVINMGMKEMNINIGMGLKNPRTKKIFFPEEKIKIISKISSNNEGEISKIADMIPSDLKINPEISKNEAIIYDNSAIYNDVDEEDIKIDFKDNGKEKIKENNKINRIINNLETSPLRQYSKRMERRPPDYGDKSIKTNSNGVKIKNLNIPQEIQNHDENDLEAENTKTTSFEKYNQGFLQFLKKLKSFSDYSYSMTEWIAESYKWVESRYLRSRIIKTKNEKKSKEM